jgi:SAM-dependent methyltransferase
MDRLDPDNREMSIDHLCRWLVSAWRKVLTRVQFRRYGRLVKQSGLFEDRYYLSQNPDVAKAGVDPIRHYFVRGAYEGRDPHPLFDSTYYLAQNPDVASAGVNPLAHYLVRGAYEGRDPNPHFDSGQYLSRNPDVANFRGNPLVHYIMHRKAEDWSPRPTFSPHSEGNAISHAGRLFHILPPTESNLLNVPERELIERVVGGYWPDTFLISGQETADNIEFILAKVGQSISSFEHILDFGCGCARTARFMIPYGAAAKPVCVDVDETQISYCKAVLPSLGEYILIPEVPPMPLDPKRFDLIYSISTFTHFRDDFQHHWLRELKRVSAPRGTLVLTIAGPRNRQYASPKDLKRLEREGFSFIEGTQRGSHNPEYYHLALHSHEYIRRVWGEYFEIVDIVPQIINNNQDVVLCRNTR